LITGGAISYVVDAFSRNKKIKYTCVAHEQAAAMMADAYSRCEKVLVQQWSHLDLALKI
jgi:thiamine pyrophosphate-dependent acetolactate synthase large subunit-like protein